MVLLGRILHPGGGSPPPGSPTSSPTRSRTSSRTILGYPPATGGGSPPKRRLPPPCAALHLPFAPVCSLLGRMWVQHQNSRPQAGCLVAIGAPATISPLMTRPANAGAVVAAHTWVCHCNLCCRLPEAVPSGAHPHLGRMGEGGCHYRTPNAPLGAHIPGRTQAAHAPAAVVG